MGLRWNRTVNRHLWYQGVIFPERLIRGLSNKLLFVGLGRYLRHLQASGVFAVDPTNFENVALLRPVDGSGSILYQSDRIE